MSTTTTTTTRQLPLITKTELAAAKSKVDKVYVSLDNRKVYDMTEFLESHPGGGDLIEDYAGKDVTAIMKDIVSHDHSDSAYEMMEDDYLVAILATDEEEAKLLRNNPDREFFKAINVEVDSEKELTVTTDFSQDWNKNKFLDLKKPLLLQVLLGNFSKQFYLDQIHKPRHYGKGSAPIFGNFLEPISKTPWFMIPLLWIPADMYAASLALKGLSVIAFVSLYVLGLCIWTLLEYIMHRCLFHIDDYLPERQWAYTLHFLLHGVHHYLPMDKNRLVMPPALLVVLASPFYRLAHLIFPYYMAMAVFSGAFMGYVMYDCTHYFLHHVRLPAFLKELKVYHLDHHYKNYELGFGVTSPFWDHVFGTVLDPKSAKIV